MPRGRGRPHAGGPGLTGPGRWPGPARGLRVRRRVRAQIYAPGEVGRLKMAGWQQFRGQKAPVTMPSVSVTATMIMMILAAAPGRHGGPGREAGELARDRACVVPHLRALQCREC